MLSINYPQLDSSLAFIATIRLSMHLHFVRYLPICQNRTEAMGSTLMDFAYAARMVQVHLVLHLRSDRVQEVSGRFYVSHSAAGSHAACLS